MQAQFSAHIHLSNLINKVIISEQNDMQNCVKMWKLKTAYWVSYLGSTQVQTLSPKKEMDIINIIMWKRLSWNHHPHSQFSHGPYLTLKKVIGLTEAHQDKF